MRKVGRKYILAALAILLAWIKYRKETKGEAAE